MPGPVIYVQNVLTLHNTKNSSVPQGPRSNFKIGGGGGTINDSILGGHKTLFLTNSLLILKILGGGGHVPPPLPPYSAVPVPEYNTFFYIQRNIVVTSS